MGEKLSASIVAVALVAPLCALCIAGPAFLVSVFAGVTSWFGGLSSVPTTGLAVMAAIIVYGLLSRKKRRIGRSSDRTSVS